MFSMVSSHSLACARRTPTSTIQRSFIHSLSRLIDHNRKVLLIQNKVEEINGTFRNRTIDANN